ncbi:lipoate--protein ligase family protein [Macrococcus carouselicus]|uniref:Octanoyltransferase LipM n=1 Tax=Macrococcus carouselicus TaxID=69969 RepID=A0A9Q8CN62_9STAP|nr:biotin/lipoate A/B protein ligase family protein [Macrococcus carouselicus]TDM04333.1 lipoate--protein ligase family protein [Macrococcus carouselicus]
MTEQWLFINTKKQNPYFNMALDEALLNWVSEGKMQPVIRFYGWNPRTLSIGYFQKLEKEIDIEKVKANDIGLVRRTTGGRGVLHDKELTYSVVVPESHPDMPQAVTEAYRVISNGLLEGFKELGFDAEFAIPRTEEQKAKLRDPRSSVCFDAPSWYELVVEGRKVAGSAQTRQKGVILQHGSILQDIDTNELFDLFIYKNPRMREKMQNAFSDKAVAINDLSDRHVTIKEMEEAFHKGFEKGLGIELVPYELTNEQLEEVYQIADKYMSDEWTYRR